MVARYTTNRLRKALGVKELKNNSNNDKRRMFREKNKIFYFSTAGSIGSAYVQYICAGISDG
jgi:hypothetical protein